MKWSTLGPTFRHWGGERSKELMMLHMLCPHNRPMQWCSINTTGEQKVNIYWACLQQVPRHREVKQLTSIGLLAKEQQQALNSMLHGLNEQMQLST